MDGPAPDPELLRAALAKASPEQVAALLAQTASPDLLRQLQELAANAQPREPAPTADAPAREEVGAQIGPYRLLQELGEGGMGTVFLAEQQHPVERRVALKIIKAGMDSRQVLARFEAEEQALAMMDHPNIAKVFDAGVTQAGRPYFVMELVKGIPITQYCDQEHLTPRERLELFIPVCQAIQHAHQKGIIHRDLKPSNVIVALYDGKPVPKVIDFGVAKATGAKLTERTMFTEVGQMVGTLEYMAPEQAELNKLDIDTRADIYSLGVLLYELLTGSPPFTSRELRSAAFDEMLRIIREVEPPKPSTKLSSSDQLPAIAAKRKLEPQRLTKLVSGELDWIVMKCLEKERARRYETANGLAADIEHYLHDQPVLAGPPSRAYRLRKFVRRNRTLLSTIAIVAAVLLVAVFVSTWQAVRATTARTVADEARRNAETQANIATSIVDLLQQMLASANPDENKGSDYTVRALLDEFSAHLDADLKLQPEVEATVRSVTGVAYNRLGLTAKAEPHLKRSLELYRSVFGDDDERVAEGLVNYAWNFHESDENSEAEILAREAISILRKRGDKGDATIRALSSLAQFLWPQGKHSEVDMVAREALELARTSGQNGNPEIGKLLHRYSTSMRERNELVKAESLAQQSVAVLRNSLGPNHPETGWAMLSLGLVHEKMEEYDAAESDYQQSLTIFRRHYDLSHKSVRAAVACLLTVLDRRHDLEAIKIVLRENCEGTAQPRDAEGSGKLLPVFVEDLVRDGQPPAQWWKATETYWHLTRITPWDARVWQSLAVIYLHSRDITGYQLTCQHASRGLSVGSVWSRAFLVEVCSLAPQPNVDRAELSRMAANALGASEANATMALALGMNEYRRGDFEAAIRDLPVNGDCMQVPLSLFFRAMAQQKLGQTTLAQATFRDGISQVESGISSVEGPPLDYYMPPRWVVWSMIQIVRQEAETLIEPTSADTEPGVDVSRK